MYISTLDTSLEFQFCIFKVLVITTHHFNKHLKFLFVLNLIPEFSSKNCSENNFTISAIGKSTLPFTQATCLGIILDDFLLLSPCFQSIRKSYWLYIQIYA